jgi:hypothetical protein
MTAVRERIPPVPSTTARSDVSDRSLAELTQAAVGRSLSMAALFDLVERQSIESRGEQDADRIWLGSVGYESFKTNADFARMLVRAGVERLIDVRELPISRKRGFAKSALAGALEAEGIEYVHVKSLGNPKAYRDLYKSGNVEEGRGAYGSFLREERRDALRELEALVAERRSALMCVEHEESVCHRQVILEALAETGLALEVNRLG